MALTPVEIGDTIGEQAAKINAGLLVAGDAAVSRVSSQGIINAYQATADTDEARGVALQAAAADALTGDSIYLHGTTYQLNGVDEFAPDTDIISMVGVVGSTVIRTNLPTGNSKSGFRFKNGSTVNVSGIVFMTDANDTTYGTEHFYNVIFSTHGSATDCGFVINSSVTAMNAGGVAKNVVQLDQAAMVFTNCVFHSVYTETAGGEHGSFHADTGGSNLSGRLYNSMDTCYFLGQNLSSMFNLDCPMSTNCQANTPNAWDMGNLNRATARSVCPVVSRPYLDDDMYLVRSKYLGMNTYHITSSITQDATNQVVMEIRDVNTTPLVYEVEISAGYVTAGGSNRRWYYHAMVYNGQAQELNTFSETPARISYVANVGGPDQLILNGDIGTNLSFTIKVNRTRNGGATTTRTYDRYNQEIELFDIGA